MCGAIHPLGAIWSQVTQPTNAILYSRPGFRGRRVVAAAGCGQRRGTAFSGAHFGNYHSPLVRTGVATRSVSDPARRVDATYGLGQKFILPGCCDASSRRGSMSPARGSLGRRIPPIWSGMPRHPAYIKRILIGICTLAVTAVAASVMTPAEAQARSPIAPQTHSFENARKASIKKRSTRRAMNAKISLSFTSTPSPTTTATSATIGWTVKGVAHVWCSLDEGNGRPLHNPNDVRRPLWRGPLVRRFRLERKDAGLHQDGVDDHKHGPHPHDPDGRLLDGRLLDGRLLDGQPLPRAAGSVKHNCTHSWRHR